MTNTVKKLKVYKKDGEFVIERINEFNHSWKKSFVTEEGLKAGLDSYRPVMDEYEIEAADGLFALVANHLNK
ncbi:hypothetical protein DRW41_22060 [Neobacillus piezotolerans]|uniref:Uncharacterized protein n=1 Tax=Neobacillus piezotolerans TaxID=2259171 RepID=A0A3D8GK68_9BACI|nr:hypothetical protein [Neobacillus piezotolerans]RDU34712.1 hypothetical protein DRW41_22060 [Neobacillus piezotolerans]